MDRRIRVHLARVGDRLALGIAKIACAFRSGTANRVVARFFAALNKKFVFSLTLSILKPIVG